jgi:hypothetical protein
MLIVLIVLIVVRCLIFDAASSFLGSCSPSNERLAKLSSNPSAPIAGTVLSILVSGRRAVGRGGAILGVVVYRYQAVGGAEFASPHSGSACGSRLSTSRRR